MRRAPKRTAGVTRAGLRVQRQWAEGCGECGRGWVVGCELRVVGLGPAASHRAAAPAHRGMLQWGGALSPAFDGLAAQRFRR